MAIQSLTNSLTETDCTCCECSETTQQTIECFNATGDGNTVGFVLPWAANDVKTLHVLLDGVFQASTTYSATINSATTTLYFNTAPGAGVNIEILGFQVTPVSAYHVFSETATGLDDVYTISWIAPNEESLIILFNGVKQDITTYSLTYLSTGATKVTFTSPVTNGINLVIIGVDNYGAHTYKYMNSVGNNTTTDFTVPWIVNDECTILIYLDGAKVDHTDYSVQPINDVQTTVSFTTAPGNLVNIEFVGFTGFDTNSCGSCDIDVKNLGIGGEAIFSSSSVSNGTTTINLRTLKAGSGLSLTTSSDFITISNDGYSNTGAGAEILKDPIVTTVDFRTLVAGTGITVTQNADDIEISAQTSGIISSLIGTIDLTSGTVQAIGTIPADATVLRTHIIVDTISDAATTIEVGIPTDANAYMSTTENDPTTAGVYLANKFETNGNSAVTAQATIATPGTVGSARIIIEYRNI